ncbi:uncharacterized protein [Henckelia pumila]|uniref:uncharacterized protein isoform X2 n=1 Tax=Henckelia pumila TaxID=405737 RepID=UPI003C6E985B
MVYNNVFMYNNFIKSHNPNFSSLFTNIGAMAIRYSTSLYSSPILPLKYASIKVSANCRVAMCANTSQFSVSSVKNKVFEDRSAGVVCYEDENGEIICEGVDEGPRFQPQSISIFDKNKSSKNIEIIDLFQRCWLQPIDEDHELKSEDKGFSVQTDFNINGFNKLG